MKIVNWKFIIILILVLILGFFLFSKKPQSVPVPAANASYLKIAGQNIKIEIADTPDKQELGLSGRKELKENEGMLFVFEKSEIYPFWMKDMNFPIDIIWLDADKKAIYIKENAKPEDYPKTYSSAIPAKYVLEVVAGFSEKNNLKVGDLVQF